MSRSSTTGFISAVATSIVCGGLYYKSDCLLRSIIAYAYVFMLVGYATTYAFEVGR
jgi:hypothetical protein